MNSKKDWAQYEDSDQESEEEQVSQPALSNASTTEEKKVEVAPNQPRDNDRPHNNPDRPRRTAEETRAENLQKLDEIDRKDVWIFVLKNPAYIESTNNKIEELKPIKRYENEKGWDVLLDKQLVRNLLTNRELRFPKFLIGKKNFYDPNREQRGGRGGRGGADRKYREEQGGKKYREKNEQRHEKHDDTSEGSNLGEFAFNKGERRKKEKDDFKNREARDYKDRDYKDRDYKDREHKEPREFKEPRPRDPYKKQKRMGEQIGSFRNKPKEEQSLPDLSEQRNLVQINRQGSKVETSILRNTQQLQGQPQLKKSISMPNSYKPLNKPKYKQKLTEQPVKPQQQAEKPRLQLISQESSGPKQKVESRPSESSKPSEQKNEVKEEKDEESESSEQEKEVGSPKKRRKKKKKGDGVQKTMTLGKNSNPFNILS